VSTRSHLVPRILKSFYRFRRPLPHSIHPPHRLTNSRLIRDIFHTNAIFHPPHQTHILPPSSPHRRLRKLRSRSSKGAPMLTSAQNTSVYASVRSCGGPRGRSSTARFAVSGSRSATFPGSALQRETSCPKEGYAPCGLIGSWGEWGRKGCVMEDHQEGRSRPRERCPYRCPTQRYGKVVRETFEAAGRREGAFEVAEWYGGGSFT
jgi:hypothetical protein